MRTTSTVVTPLADVTFLLASHGAVQEVQKVQEACCREWRCLDAMEPKLERSNSRMQQWRSAARRAITSLHTDKHTTETSQGCQSALTSIKQKQLSGRKWFPSSFRRHHQQGNSSTSSGADPPSSDKSQISTNSSDKTDIGSGCRMGSRVSCGDETAFTTCSTAAVAANQKDTADQPNDSSTPEPQGTTDTGHSPARAAEETTRSVVEAGQKMTEVVEEGGSLACGSSQGCNKLSEVNSAAPPETAAISSDEEEQQSVQTKAINKRRYVVQEMIDTEREYIKSLSQVVDGYLKLMRDEECTVPLPEDLASGRDKIIFGNIESIYEWHRDFFLKALDRCISQPKELGSLFKRYERKLHMYVVYCQNKPKSEHIVSDHLDSYFEELRKLLNYKHQLPDLLIQPIQRIMRYQLLLREIHKLTSQAGLQEEADAIQKAVQVMIVVPKAADDMMNVGRLQGFDGKITQQGKLLMHGKLICADGLPAPTFRGKEYAVFLFEQNVIFSEALVRRNAFVNPGYLYRSHIQVNKMCLKDRCDDSDPCKFSLRSTDPHKPDLLWTCQAASEPEHATWVRQLRAMLQTQQNFLKAIQSPIAFQKELTKEP